MLARIMVVVTHGIKDAIDIECRVYNQGGIENVLPYITSLSCVCRLPRQREKPLWRIRDVFVCVAGIVA
jgi:hypothetical protein